MENEMKTVDASSGSNTITIKKDHLWKYSTFLLLALVIVGGFIAFRGGGGASTGAVVGTAPTPSAVPSQPSRVSASADDDPFLGDENAPVTIIEFSDYQCPFCRRFWSQTLDQIKSEYVDTGKVRFVYRDFPLTSIHPGAQPAAEAAECVREQDGDEAYFKYHDKIFSEQSKQGQGTVQFGANDLKLWAQDLGYDIGSCLDSGKFGNEVQKDSRDAQAAGGRGTPFFVIVGKDGKGTPLSGAQTFGAFKQIIDVELR